MCVYVACSQQSSHQDFSRQTDSAGNYLRQIAAVHDWKQAAASLGSEVDQLRQDLQSVTQAVMASCAQQLVLPEVKVGSNHQNRIAIALACDAHTRLMRQAVCHPGCWQLKDRASVLQTALRMHCEQALPL